MYACTSYTYMWLYVSTRKLTYSCEINVCMYILYVHVVVCIYTRTPDACVCMYTQINGYVCTRKLYVCTRKLYACTRKLYACTRKLTGACKAYWFGGILHLFVASLTAAGETAHCVVAVTNLHANTCKHIIILVHLHAAKGVAHD
jgi:hypothetical protein